MRPARHQAGEMGHVHHEIGAHLIGDLAEGGEINLAGIGAAAGQDQLGLVFAGQGRDLVHVNALVVLAHRVGDRLEPFAGIIGGMAVGEMAARRQVQAHEGVARIEQGVEHFLVGVGAGMGLHIGVRAAEQFAGAVNRQLFGDIDIFAAAIIALAGIAFGVFVGQHRALGFQHRLGDDVLGRDQFDLVALAVQFIGDGAGDLRVGLAQAFGEKSGILHALSARRRRH